MMRNQGAFLMRNPTSLRRGVIQWYNSMVITNYIVMKLKIKIREREKWLIKLFL